MNTHLRTAAACGTWTVRRALAVAGCGVLSVTLSACESTQEESAKLNHEGQRLISQRSLDLGAVNHSVRAAHVTLLSAGGRTAVAVQLTGTASRTQADVPLLVSVTGAGGRQLYSNGTAGLEPSLQRIALLAPRRPAWWVNDQVLSTQPASAAHVRVGTGRFRSTRALPEVVVSGARAGEQSGVSVISGTVSNRSAVAQEKLPIFAVALRAGRVVAAGRAVVESLPAHSRPRAFQIFPVGELAGARLVLTVAPPVS